MSLDPSAADMPSLNALRAFESAARHQSFRDAAEELVVSPAAIAQHVKAVERWAEQSLFDRSAHGVTLNEAGQRVLPELSEGFATLRRAAVTLRARRQSPRTLRIAALPAIAQLWLASRLDEITALAVGSDVSVHARDVAPDLLRSPYDVAIYYGPVDRDDPVEADRLIAVGSPAVANGVERPSDLAGVRLLHDTTWRGDAAEWMHAAELSRAESAPARSFSLFALAVDAAVRGAGVLIGRESLLESYLTTGELVQVTTVAVPTAEAICLEVRSRDELGVAALVSWADQAGVIVRTSPS